MNHSLLGTSPSPLPTSYIPAYITLKENTHKIPKEINSEAYREHLIRIFKFFEVFQHEELIQNERKGLQELIALCRGDISDKEFQKYIPQISKLNLQAISGLKNIEQTWAHEDNDAFTHNKLGLYKLSFLKASRNLHHMYPTEDIALGRTTFTLHDSGKLFGGKNGNHPEWSYFFIKHFFDKNVNFSQRLLLLLKEHHLIGNVSFNLFGGYTEKKNPQYKIRIKGYSLEEAAKKIQTIENLAINYAMTCADVKAIPYFSNDPNIIKWVLENIEKAFWAISEHLPQKQIIKNKHRKTSA